MQDIELQQRLQSIGVPRAKAREVTREIRDTLHPVAAVAARKLSLVRDARARGVAPVTRGVKKGGLGSLGGSVKTVASGAATGASVAGPIGAVVGAVIGLFMPTGQKRARALEAGQYIAEMRKLPAPGGVGRMIDWDEYQHLFWGLFLASDWLAHPGAHHKEHPSEMTALYQNFRDYAKSLVQAAIDSRADGQNKTATAPGGATTYTVNFGIQPLASPGEPASIDNFVAGVLVPAFADYAAKMGLSKWGPDQQNYAFYDLSHDAARDARKVFGLLVDKWAGELDPPAPSQAVATLPAVDVPMPVVQAAQPIVQANVPVATAPNVPAPTMVTPPPGTTITPVVTAFAPNAPGAITAGLNPTQDATAALLQQLLSQQQGMNFVSPRSQQLLADVATEGVAQTPAGPSSTPAWLIPAAIAGGVGVLAIIMLSMRKR